MLKLITFFFKSPCLYIHNVIINLLLIYYTKNILKWRTKNGEEGN